MSITEMKEKGYLLLVLLTLVTSLLLGCGKGTKPNTVLPEPSNEEQATTLSEPAPIPLPLSQEISWAVAKDHINEKAVVCGPVVGARYAEETWGKPTYLYIGKPPPNSDRFDIVIWEINRHSFSDTPERFYLGKIVCVEGLIQDYNGIPYIEVETPGQIQE